MGFRFQRRLKLFPGVRLNFSRGGISTTVGVRGASFTLGRQGTYVNLGIPGSGLSFRQRIVPVPGRTSDPRTQSYVVDQPDRQIQRRHNFHHGRQILIKICRSRVRSAVARSIR